MAISNVTERLARVGANHRWRVIAAWLVAVLVSAAAIAGLLGSALTTDDDFTGQPEAQRAEQLLQKAFPPVRAADRGFQVDETVIVSSPRMTADDPRFAARLDSLAGGLRTAGAAEVQRGPVSQDGHSRLLLVELGRDVEPVVARVEAANGRQGFEALIVGEDSIDEDFSRAADEDLARGELFGLALALLVLILVFRGVVAAVVPIAVAAASIVVALAVVAGIGQAFVLNFVVVNVLVMMGLAVGIDYSLFVVSRYREERAAGAAPADAIAVAGSTASRAVLFSGATVVLALLGMFLVPQTIFRSIAVGAIVVVLVAVLAALTLLPATLAVLGDRIERMRVPGGRAGTGIWSRLAGVALHRPAVSLAAGVAILVALAVPLASIDTGTAGVSTLPEGFQTRAAYEQIEDAFGPQGTSSAEVVVKGERTPELRAAVARLEHAVGGDPKYGKASVDVAPDGTVTRVTVPVDADASGPAAIAAVKELRERHVPEAFAGVRAETLVGGQSADELDFAGIASDRAPLVFAFVLGLSFLVLVVAFRSLAIPLTAIATNLLSVGAAYGLLVLVFQDGVARDLLGFQAADTIESWLPLFLFTILFGLSMDYHVFLLSRIRERWLATGDTRESVAFGVRTTARLITGAALIMVAVFAGFAGGQLVMFQQMGFGLGAAVLIDATLVRSVIVPAAMVLLGRANWWLPGRMRARSRLAPSADAA